MHFKTIDMFTSKSYNLFIHILYELIIYVYTILKREEGLHMADNKNKSMLKKPLKVLSAKAKLNLLKDVSSYYGLVHSF